MHTFSLYGSTLRNFSNWVNWFFSASSPVPKTAKFHSHLGFLVPPVNSWQRLLALVREEQRHVDSQFFRISPGFSARHPSGGISQRCQRCCKEQVWQGRCNCSGSCIGEDEEAAFCCDWEAGSGRRWWWGDGSHRLGWWRQVGEGERACEETQGFRYERQTSRTRWRQEVTLLFGELLWFRVSLKCVCLINFSFSVLISVLTLIFVHRVRPDQMRRVVWVPRLQLRQSRKLVWTWQISSLISLPSWMLLKK